MKTICFVLISLMSLSCSNIFVRNPKVKKKYKNGTIQHFEYNNGLLIKTFYTKNGIREGISESIYIDDGEYLRVVSIYSNGILQEQSHFSNNGTLVFKVNYYDGIQIETKVLTEIDENLDKHYIIKRSSLNCKSVQYYLLNETIIDSTFHDCLDLD